MEINKLYSYFLECTFITTDTRKIEPGCMFVALKGERFDANTFAEEAIAKGARYAVIDNPNFFTGNKMLVVSNTLTALQELASYHRRALGLPIIALTGSNGKTTTKELMSAVLSRKYNIKATPGNFNNHIGLPLTILSFTKETEIGIVEMGANHQKEIEFLCTIAEPDFGYITNFGKAHLEGFGGIEGVIKGKSELYTYLEANKKTAFVNLDDNLQKEKTQHLPRYTFALHNDECDVKLTTDNTSHKIAIKHQDITIYPNMVGSYNIPNICAAVTIGTFFKVSNTDIKEAIEHYYPDNNRSQLINKNTNTIILDAYNANPSSTAAALDNFTNFEGSKIAILGDMFELGNESIKEHREIVNKAADLNNIRFYFIGKDYYAANNNTEHLSFYKTYDEFTEYFKTNIPQKKTILIKGSRGMALERLMDIL